MRRAPTTGRIMNVGLHPHVSGRAHRIRALREFIEHAKSLPGVWWATREEIADWYLAEPREPYSRPARRSAAGMKAAHVLIAGGGIGGLTAALALLQRGFAVDVFESARAWADIGAGVTLAPNAMRVMQHLGIADQIDGEIVEPVRQQVRHWQDGRVLMALDRGTRMRDLYHAPYVYAHRADLHVILVAAVEALGGRLHLVVAVTAVSADADGAHLTLADGTVATGDLVVGADGLKSVVRLLQEPAPAHFTGHIAFRSLVPVTPELRELADNPGNFIGPGRLAVFYRLRGGTLLNLVFFGRQPGWTDDGWTIPAKRVRARDAVRGLVRARPADDRGGRRGQSVQMGDQRADRRCETWSIDGRITLLGDAAHAMTPFLGQGASSAIEDALVLARAIAAADTLPEALGRYEAARIARTSMIQTESNDNADRMQGDDADLFGMSKLRNEETLGLFAYDAGTVAV